VAWPATSRAAKAASAAANVDLMMTLMVNEDVDILMMDLSSLEKKGSQNQTAWKGLVDSGVDIWFIPLRSP
jgi:hypothetical protein